jgi:hypothetical protein
MADEKQSQDPPGAVSNQNSEEAEAGHEEDRDYGLRRMRPVESDEQQTEEENDGGASEGSQSTGHPESAG